MPEKNILVTGGSGFIGYNLIDSLNQNGHKITTISRRKHVPHLGNLVDRLIVGDIRDPEIVNEAIQGVDFVFHLAALQPTTSSSSEEMISVARDGTRNVLVAAAEHGITRVVIASSISCCGFTKDGKLLDETDNADGDSLNTPYESSKIATESLALNGTWPMEVIIARMAKVYGSGDYYGNNSTIPGKLKKSFLFVPSGSGSYVGIKDCTRALELLSEQGKPGEKYIVSSENLPFRKIYEYFTQASGSNATLIPVPESLKLLLPLARSAFSPTFYEVLIGSFKDKPTTSDKLRNLGWAPVQPVRDAIEQAVSFYEHHLYDT